MKLSPDQIIVDAIHQYYRDADHTTPACWFIDDNASTKALEKMALLAKQQPHLIFNTNRFDKFLALKNQLPDKDQQVIFNDFDLSQQTQALQAIFFRVAKEKPLNLYWINQAFEHLATGGELIFVGNKGDGIKSIIKHAENRFNVKAQQIKHKPDAILAIVKKSVGQNIGPVLDDRNYTELRAVASQDTIAGSPIKDVMFYSKPGVFGWDKIDQGSLLLVDSLPAVFNSLKDKPKRVLDLGCGYGYITTMAAQLAEFDEIIATDNNATALLAAEKTFAENGIPAKSIATDAGEQISEKFDLILCNPPFHQGFSVDGGLTKKFLTNTKRLLNKHGHAIYVVNAFIGVEKIAAQLGLKTQTIVNNNQFKVLVFSV